MVVLKIIDGFQVRYNNGYEFDSAIKFNPLIKKKNWVPLGIWLMTYTIFLDCTSKEKFIDYFDFCDKNTKDLWSCNHNSFYFKDEIDATIFRLIL